MRLFHYDHCPYCVKARMIFGFKGLPFELIPLANDDEATPVSMIGVKMVPILQKEDGTSMPESMDIVAYVDGLDGKPLVAPALTKDDPSGLIVETFLNGSRAFLYALAMPRWAKMDLPEFSAESARAYFVKKKEAFVGPFASALEHTPELTHDAEEALAPLNDAPWVRLGAEGARGISVTDFHLFAALRALSCVKDLFFPPQVAAYMDAMSRRAGVPLHREQAL